MRLITYTNLFPDPDRPRHGVFVRERLEQIVREPGISAEVIAIRPGGTSRGTSKGKIDGPIPVVYHSVPKLPGVTNWIDPIIWARWSRSVVRDTIGNNLDNVILDAHFLYPDGVAATLIGRALGIPVVLTARGSDVNVKCANPVMRSWIRWSAARSAGLITVSQALLDKLRSAGVHCRRTCVIPNGVDLARFRPVDREILRTRPGVDGEILLSVGHLLPAKGHEWAIRALPLLPESQLVVVGDGPDRDRLVRLANEIGVTSRVSFVGTVDPDRMPALYTAADVLILASEREGMPNVVLESLACGTPVVASGVGGIPEVITSPVAGRVINDCNEVTIAEAVKARRTSEVSRESVREFAHQFDWQSRISAQIELYEDVLAAGRQRSHAYG
jgi:glycosyltransferase involved in cell wall biosynthesis